MSGQQTFLDLDERPQAIQKFLGYRDDQLLVLGQPLISHGGDRTAALFTRFVDDLRRKQDRLFGLPDAGVQAVVGSAATSAIEADPELTAQENGGLSFVLACREDAASVAWRLCLLGAYYVLHFCRGGAREVLVPQSVYREAMAKGVPRSVARDFAGAPTLAAVPGKHFDADIRTAEVRLAAGEVLVALPEPAGLVEPGERVEAPMDLSAIRALAGRLRAERDLPIGNEAMLSQSLFAIVHPAESSSGIRSVT